MLRNDFAIPMARRARVRRATGDGCKETARITDGQHAVYKRKHARGGPAKAEDMTVRTENFSAKRRKLVDESTSASASAAPSTLQPASAYPTTIAYDDAGQQIATQELKTGEKEVEAKAPVIKLVTERTRKRLKGEPPRRLDLPDDETKRYMID